MIIKLSATIAIASDHGSKTKPYPMIWPKRAWNSYPTIYLGPTFSGTMEQDRLKKIEGKDEAQARQSDPGLVARVKEWKKVKAYKPNGGGKLPKGEANIGIKGVYRIQTGSKFKLPNEPQTTPGGGKLIGPLLKYGFSFSGEKVDADHVKEIQVGGHDKLENLWPLNASENRSGGSSISRMKFGTGEKMKQLKAKAKNKEVWLQIKSTKPA